MKLFLKGRPLRLAVLDYGLFKVHENDRAIGICGYVVQTDADENVLIDTGFPKKYAQDAGAAAREDALDGFGEVLKLAAENLAPAQLALLGLAPSDITLMIQSHTHIDHIGFIDAFPGVPILISKAERALPRPLYWSDKKAVDWPQADYLMVESDTTIASGFDVLHVPGHTPGQLAFGLQLPRSGPILLTSDAISRTAELDDGFKGAWDVNLAQHHAKRLMRRATRDSAKVIFGHCPEQWPTLLKAPDWYT